jgi:hypothetical protein
LLEKGTTQLHAAREGGDSEKTFNREASGLEDLRQAESATDGIPPLDEGILHWDPFRGEYRLRGGYLGAKV